MRLGSMRPGGSLNPVQCQCDEFCKEADHFMRLSTFLRALTLTALVGGPLYAQTPDVDPPLRLLFIPDDQASAAEIDDTVSVIAFPDLPQTETVKSEVLATLLRSNPVSSFIAAPEELGGSTGQLFMSMALSISLAGEEGEGEGQVAAAKMVQVGGETMPFDVFGARLSALIDAFSPEHRQIAFFNIQDPENSFAASVSEFQKAVNGSGFAMAVISVGDVPENCRTAVEPYLAMIAGIADREPFGDADGTSTAAEAESWLTGALARPARRDPACAGAYHVIINSNNDPAKAVAYHGPAALLPDLETRLYLEKFEAEFLVRSDDASQISAYLQSCVYCPNEASLAKKLQDLQEFALMSDLESSVWEQIKSDDRPDRLEVYLANCSLCAFRSEAETLIAELAAKAAAREAENAIFLQAKASGDLAGLRDYASSCVACDHRDEAEGVISEIEAAAAYKAEKAALEEAIEAKDRSAIETWLSGCVTCDDRAAAEAALAEIAEAETLIGPCEREAGMPSKGGPRQLADIDLAAARKACNAASSALPHNAMLKVLSARIDQAEGKFAEATAAYEAAIEAEVPEAFGLLAYLRFSPPDGAAPDYEAASSLARSGAALGDWLSKEILILIYSRELVAGNGPAEAFTLAQESAAEGNIVGQFFLGYFLLSGVGTAVNENEAAVWLRRASDAGYLRAKPFLAELLERGEVTDASAEEVARLLWDALSGGDDIAFARLTEQLPERSAEVIRIIQQKLRDAGAYDGRDDGLAGPGTVRAVRAYAETLQQSG